MNVGLYDRMFRIALGAALVFWAVYFPTQPYSYLGWIGIIPFATGVFGWCGLYRVLGISTQKSA